MQRLLAIPAPTLDVPESSIVHYIRTPDEVESPGQPRPNGPRGYIYINPPTDVPPNPNAGLTPVNINYVFGMNDAVAQTLVHPYVWFAGMMIGLPLIVYWPTHLLLSRFAPKPS